MRQFKIKNPSAGLRTPRAPQGRSKGLKFKMTVAVFFLFATASADLEWITGGVPKNTPEPGSSSSVPDAPPTDGKTQPVGNSEVIVGHLTTCTKFTDYPPYPADSKNYFYLDKDKQICYFAYFIMKPSSRIHTAIVECFSPSNLSVARYERAFTVGFTDNLLTVQNETYQWFLVQMTLGLDRLRVEYGQKSMPRDEGRYTLHLTVDGQLVGITFFSVQGEEPKPPSAVSTVVPIPTPKVFPMFTPSSKGPIQRTPVPVLKIFTPVPALNP